MLQNYFKIALRSILKNRVYSFINIIGLAIGLTCFILLGIHVTDEFSYDKFHAKGDNLYKVVLERSYPDHITNYAVIPHSFSDVLVNDIPEVKNAVRLFGGGNNPVMVTYVNDQEEKKAFEETRFMLADSTFFDLFSIPLLKGDPKIALSKPQTIVLTESTAKKYFGDENPIDKMLNTDFGDFKVSGVCGDVPENSHFEFDFIGSLNTLQFIANNLNFTGFTTHMYLELSDGTNPQKVEAIFPSLVETYAAPQIEAGLNTSFKEYTDAGNGYKYSLIPLNKIHLFPVEYQLALKPGGNINDMYILISIAILILVIACINFMNLATARSTERAKEVGIRKTLGSYQKQLVSQFIAEAIVTSSMAMILAMVLVQLFLPGFNTLVGKSLAVPFEDPLTIGAIFFLVIFIGLLAGFYPAFVLSSFNPITVMKGRLATNKNSSMLRNTLVVVQFIISIVLIIGTLVVKDQLDFIKNKNLGYNKENLVVIERTNILEDKQESFLEELRTLASVKSVASSGALPINQYFGIQFQIPGASEVLTTNAMVIDDYYGNTLEFEIVKGRGFSKDFNDSLSIIINEQTAALLNTDNPIGTIFKTSNGNPPADINLTIIGVVKDFNYMSLKERITPFVLLSQEGGLNNFPGLANVRIDSENPQQTIASLEKVWNQFAPNEPFKYQFLDSHLDVLYKNEANTGKVFGAFSTIAILIACVGLFGLAAYITSLRAKEIGIRKVMGANVGSVVVLLSKDFALLVIIALLISIPLSWYVMNQWLDSFAYRTEIRIGVFFISGLIAISISVLTVSYQSIKAAIVNPVVSLRSE